MLPPIDEKLHTLELIESLQKPAMEATWIQNATKQDAEISAADVGFLAWHKKHRRARV